MAKQSLPMTPARASGPPGSPVAPERSFAWLQGLLCGVAAALVPGPALLIGLLLAPGLLALMLDHAPGKPLARAVLLAGLAVAIGPIASLWHGGGGIGAALGMLGDPAILGLAWLAGAAGWLASELAPLFLKIALDGASAARAAHLKSERARLLEAWDLGAAADDQAAEGKPS